MPRSYATRKVIKVLEFQGFVFYSQKGSYTKYRKKEGWKILTVIIPMHGKEILYGTLRSILRQSHLEEKYFS